VKVGRSADDCLQVIVSVAKFHLDAPVRGGAIAQTGKAHPVFIIVELINFAVARDDFARDGVGLGGGRGLDDRTIVQGLRRVDERSVNIRSAEGHVRPPRARSRARPDPGRAGADEAGLIVTIDEAASRIGVVRDDLRDKRCQRRIGLALLVHPNAAGAGGIDVPGLERTWIIDPEIEGRVPAVGRMSG